MSVARTQLETCGSRRSLICLLLLSEMQRNCSCLNINLLLISSACMQQLLMVRCHGAAAKVYRQNVTCRPSCSKQRTPVPGAAGELPACLHTHARWPVAAPGDPHQLRKGGLPLPCLCTKQLLSHAGSCAHVCVGGEGMGRICSHLLACCRLAHPQKWNPREKHRLHMKHALCMSINSAANLPFTFS